MSGPKGYSTGAHVMLGKIPPCWGQCWVHRASKNLDQKCGDKPKRKAAHPPGGRRE